MPQSPRPWKTNPNGLVDISEGGEKNKQSQLLYADRLLQKVGNLGAQLLSLLHPSRVARRSNAVARSWILGCSFLRKLGQVALIPTTLFLPLRRRGQPKRITSKWSRPQVDIQAVKPVPAVPTAMPGRSDLSTSFYIIHSYSTDFYNTSLIVIVFLSLKIWQASAKLQSCSKGRGKST